MIKVETIIPIAFIALPIALIVYPFISARILDRPMMIQTRVIEVINAVYVYTVGISLYDRSIGQG